MKRVSVSLAQAGVLALMVSSAANAQVLLYDNGPFNPYGSAYYMNGTNSITDSFVLSSAASLTKADIGVWNWTGDSSTSVSWSIGTTQYATDISSGLSTTTDTFQVNNGYGFDTYVDSFAISGALAPGTYWITVSHATTADLQSSFWAVSAGASSAHVSYLGAEPSESFQIYGNTAPPRSTPEPGQFAMAAGLGLSALSVMRRRRRAS